MMYVMLSYTLGQMTKMAGGPLAAAPECLIEAGKVAKDSVLGQIQGGKWEWQRQEGAAAVNIESCPLSQLQLTSRVSLDL